MVNINNTKWDQLSFSDVEAFLVDGEENTFFEFKEDRETNEKLTKEIVAFSNTYGGYVLLGVNNDKSIGGCNAWNEQRIHTLIHDSVLPTPIFDVKKLTREDGITIYVVKVEEGPLPPYITNKGQIYERLSSGAFPVKDSGKLTLFYSKRSDQIAQIKRKIELPELVINDDLPKNLCGYLDMGFSLVCSEDTNLQKHFYDYDFTPIAKFLKDNCAGEFSISRIGCAYQISIGQYTLTDLFGNTKLAVAGMNNFIEIMYDGSVRSRLFLSTNKDTTEASIEMLVYINSAFQEIYRMIFERDISNIFIYAQKYEQLTVLKQFNPVYGFITDSPNDAVLGFRRMNETHSHKYGKNWVITGNRIPWNGYRIIDRRSITESGSDYNVRNILDSLFDLRNNTLGFIDQMDFSCQLNEEQDNA